jgi:hypothetical protein
VPRLRQHLYARLFHLDQHEDLSPQHVQACKALLISQNRIYWHKAIRLHYTTYSMERAQDYIHPDTDHCNVLLLSPDEHNPHPYWYAQVIRVFHVLVQHPLCRPPEPQRMDVLFVRWYGRDPDTPNGWLTSSLNRVGFVPHDDHDPFGFLDPSLPIREAHMVPAFAEGRVEHLLPGHSLAREGADDWHLFYVMR